MAVFQGSTVEAAINTGLTQLGVTREQANIKVISEPKKGFLGIGKKNAEVAVSRKSETQATPTSASPAKSLPASQTERPTSTTTRDQSAVAASLADVQKTNHPNNQTPNPQKQAQRQAANEQAIRDLSAYLLEIVKELGIPASLDVEFANREATLNFETEKQGLLIGKHGRTINSLQDLAQVYMNHHGASHVNVLLDVDDYRERRSATLKRLADSTAREVIATGKQVYLDPMPSFERKLIHAELADNSHVTTFSEGREPHRAVVVAIQK